MMRDRDTVCRILRRRGPLCWQSVIVCLIGLSAVYPSVSTALPIDSLAASAVDTDALVMGIKDFSRFLHPDECVAAAQQQTATLRRSLAMQYYTLFLRDTAPERDTLPLQVVAFARACGSRFTIGGITSEDLPGLFTLALLEGNDSLARAIVFRRLSLAVTGPARQDVLAEVVAGYVDAEPTRLAAAVWAAAKADTLALAEHTNSLPAHFPLLELARRAFDSQRIQQEALRIIQLGRMLDMRAVTQEILPLISAWRRLLEVAFVYHPDSVLIYAKAAKTDLSRFPWRSPLAFNFTTASVTQVRNSLLPFIPARYAVSQSLPPVNASFWFPTAPSTWPPRGHISLVLYGVNCARGGLLGGRLTLQGYCGGLQTYLRRWAEQYDSRGFVLTVVDATRGHAVLSDVLAPADEAKSLNWYYRTYLHLHATLGVVQREIVKRIAQPDGRRWYADTTAFGRMLGTNPFSQDHQLTMLFGMNGELLYAGDLDRALLNALIVRALHTSRVAYKRTHTQTLQSIASPRSSFIPMDYASSYPTF